MHTGPMRFVQLLRKLSSAGGWSRAVNGVAGRCDLEGLRECKLLAMVKQQLWR